MITKKVIDALYKKYHSRPESVYDLNLGLLFEFVADNHGIELDEHSLVINSISPDSPFHSIPLRHIHAIVEFADDIAIVLHSSIIFLKKDSPAVNINLKNTQTGLFGKLRHHLSAAML